MKQTVKGIILVFSCHKHINTRLKEFALPRKEYSGWKVFTVIGDPFLKTDYIINDNFITIKCEDSYIHLINKVVKAFKVILDIYNVEEGIIRAGDDLIINETNLLKFINIPDKSNYVGNIQTRDESALNRNDPFMVNYYLTHEDDFKNALHGFKDTTIEDIKKCTVGPSLNFIHGVIMYLSVKSCNILINHLEKINWNIFYNEGTSGFPYTIEDIGIGYILRTNNILPVDYPFFLNYYSPDVIAFHTNKYR